MLGQGRQLFERQHLLEQRYEKRCTPMEALPDSLIGDPLGTQRQRSRDFPQGLIWPAIQKDRAEQFWRRLDFAGICERSQLPHPRFPGGRKPLQELDKLGIYLGRWLLPGHGS